MQAPARAPIAAVVEQHAEESALLRHVRSVLVRAPHVRLHHLRRLDDRIAAHLDGLAVAGPYGTALCTAALANPQAGEVFAAAVQALEAGDRDALDRLLSIAAVLPDARRGLASALGWTSARQLQGIVRDLLASQDALRREMGLTACRLHEVDPGTPLASALHADLPSLRICALRAAGALGRTDLLPHAMSLLHEQDDELAFWAAWAACLLGDRGEARERLSDIALGDAPWADRALCLFLQAADFSAAQHQLRLMVPPEEAQPASKRRLVRAIGWLGDARHVPWLIGLMDDDALARLAGEAFSMISGADLAMLDLERKPPERIEAGPSENPEDDSVALDEDESLPWPDRDRVQGWWLANAMRFATGTRCFVGAPPDEAQCAQVLRGGAQRQRSLAAQQLALLRPGGRLFNVCAPAWRQQRRLA